MFSKYFSVNFSSVKPDVIVLLFLLLQLLVFDYYENIKDDPSFSTKFVEVIIAVSIIVNGSFLKRYEALL